MMKAVILVVAFVVLVAFADAQSSNINCNNLQPTSNATADWLNFLQCFPDTPQDNDHERMAKFYKCRSDVVKHMGTPGISHTIGLTKHCGMTAAEINQTRNHKLNQPNQPGNNSPGSRSAASAVDLRATTTTLPVNFSWVSKGAVSAVKNQGNCGNCYTFAAAGAVEGAYFIKHGVLYNLSSEQYTDCSANYGACLAWSQSCMGSTCTTTYYQYWASSVSWGNDGCNGGTYEACWAYNNVTGLGLNSWTCYPLSSDSSGVAGTCAYSSSCSTNVKVSNYVEIAAGDEVTMQKVIATIGPIACSLDATLLETYTGGIIPYYNSTMVDHAILVVGYGTAGGVNYWIVKNSWGTYWGEQGYFRVVRGVNSMNIASGCAYPIVA